MSRLSTLAVCLVLLTAGCNDRTDRTDSPGRVAPSEGFSDVVEGALPAIVFIQAEATLPPELDALFPQLSNGPVTIGMGSGVLFREDGYILTNNHVVQDAERVLVVLHDRRFYEAEVIGRDPSTEVAVVRIGGSGFPVARLGDSDGVRLGDWALAMGSPLGLEFSVTAGIVSGTGRDIGILGREMEPGAEQTSPLEHFIQTDAALSPGNSGGPLLNTAGEVIGINTAVAAARGTPAAIGFAIPSNLARRVADQLIRHGEVHRPYIGVALMNVTPRQAEAEGLERVEGATVARVEPDGPASQAGLQQGDVILGVDGQRIQTVSDLQADLAQRDPGTNIQLQLLRGGRETEVTVELGAIRSGSNTRRELALPVP
jgi:serine protease Do